MAVQINLNKDGLQKKGFLGFSWTTLFFGFFVPLFRGDTKWFIVMLILSFLSFGLAQLILCFLYNGIYTKSLLEKGYKPADDFAKQVLINRGFIAEDTTV